MKKAVYAGSFDPVTKGHLDIIRRAALLFDELHVVIANNLEKKTLFSANERLELIQKSLSEQKIQSPNIVVAIHSSLIVDYCHEVSAQVLLRGIRAVSDFEREFQIANMNSALNNKIETLHLMPAVEYSFVSSSLIKEVAKHNGKLNAYITECVEEKLKEKLKGK